VRPIQQAGLGGARSQQHLGFSALVQLIQGRG